MMLSEGSQTQKATYCMIPLIGNDLNKKTHRDRKISGCLGLQGGGWEVTANGGGGSFWGDENVLESDSGDGGTTL